MDKKSIKDMRKEEILEAAKRVFLKKGFAKTTMEDVIAETTLSKGGVYYHYKNTKEMIYEIFMQGNEYRIGRVKKFMEENKLTMESLADDEILAEIITEKILDVNPLIEIYAQFLIESMYDEQLYETYEKIVAKSREELSKMAMQPPKDNDFEKDAEFEFLTNLINTFILGANILKANRNFTENRQLIKEMIKIAVRYFRRD